MIYFLYCYIYNIDVPYTLRYSQIVGICRRSTIFKLTTTRKYPMTLLIDPLTKRTYEYEFRNYTQYWGLSKEQATAVMECTTYESRRLVLEAFQDARLANSRYR
jgi:hypothetical protein